MGSAMYGLISYAVHTKEKLSYNKKQWRPPSKKKKRGKNPKPEEQEGMPQRRHCMFTKRRLNDKTVYTLYTPPQKSGHAVCQA
jgi:hypothetical protein